jgi:AraC family transcriptional regulator
MEPLTRMVEHHIWLTGEMIERAARLDDDQLDQPSVDDKTLRRMLSRLVGQLDMWGCVISNQHYDWSVEQHEDVAAMRDRFAQAAPRFLAEVHEAVSGGRLDDMFINALCDPPRVYTYGAMIEHVLTFAAHNRTMAMLALKKAGISDLSFCISQAVGETCIDPSLSHNARRDARGATREA